MNRFGNTENGFDFISYNFFSLFLNFVFFEKFLGLLYVLLTFQSNFDIISSFDKITLIVLIYERSVREHNVTNSVCLLI